MPPVTGALKPFWSTPDGSTVRLYQGHVTNVLNRLPAGFVNCVVTSPPYWGLRDYGTGAWEGGDRECPHVESTKEHRGQRADRDQGGTKFQFKSVCGRCGARRVDDQIGMEELHDCLGWATGAACGSCFVCHIVQVFRELRRVLRDDGVAWLNLGDSYAGSSMTGGNDGINASGGVEGFKQARQFKNRPRAALSSGNLVGVPWRCALALQADGWVLRSDVIWAKPNPMPESVTGRCTKSHEYVFQLTKSMDYWFDNEAIQEPAEEPGETRNKRDVWWVASQPYPGAHFATFPPKLILPAVLAGCPLGGVVLDPFVGSGTTMEVAVREYRRGVGIDLNPEYLADNAVPRVEAELLRSFVKSHPLNRFASLDDMRMAGWSGPKVGGGLFV